MSSGRSSSHNSYMGGNAFEALVGAIYLDRGYDACMRFIERRILGKMINIDRVAYKEVNFKSKLIEWCQKNRIKMRFELIKQEKDPQGSPVFKFAVVLETVRCSEGSGFSKKESQQLASKLTLERLKREPQFIDEVFAAKTERTKMEEEPVEIVPETEAKDDFIIPRPIADSTVSESAPCEEQSTETPVSLVDSIAKDPDFDLSDIAVKTEDDMDREEIIAAAEAAAFEESDQ